MYTDRVLTELVAALLTAAPPVLSIDAPAGGWTTSRIVTLKGTVEHAAPLGTLTVNGVERPLPFAQGRFESTFALGRGPNAIEISAPAADGTSAPAKAQMHLYARVPRVDLQVLLFWDTDKTDVDLHVTEPSGEVINYTHTVSEKTGGRLDRDDTDGYGPEVYSVGSAPSGAYLIQAHYFGDRGSGQTTATVMAVAREGTDEERRWRFEVPLTRTGEKVDLVRLQLPPAGMKLVDPAPKE